VRGALGADPVVGDELAPAAEAQDVPDVVSFALVECECRARKIALDE
jgi:hypothetical protein